MIRKKPQTFALFLVLLFGGLLFFVGTDGFRAFTAESARVNKLVTNQPKFPQVLLEDSKGRVYPISSFENKYVFITFIYTSCTTVCLELEMNMSQVYDLVPNKYIGEEIVFLSISFDPTRDDPATLEKYRGYFGSDGETWRMARVNDQAELDRLLNTFGVIVIPDGIGNFAHNSAFYVVDKKGRLIDVMDYKEIDAVANKLVRLLEGEKGE